MNETGEVVEQGTFDKLNVPGTYVHGLKVKLGEKKEQGQENEDDIDEAGTADKIESEGPKEEDPDESRRSGGFGTYKNYFLAGMIC